MNPAQLALLIEEIKARGLMFFDEQSCKFEKLSEVELEAVVEGLKLLAGKH